MKELANKGRDHFYKGSLTKRIVSSLREKGGILIEDDFADHHGDWVEPLSGTYRGYTMYQVPPNSQGFAGLMALNILENFDFKTIPHGSFQYYHLLTESLKKAFKTETKY